MSIIHMSLDASILLVVVILIRWLLINKLPKLTFLILWGIVALKLTIPYSFYSRFDFQPMMQNLFSYITNIEASENIQGAIQVSQTPNTLYNQFLLVINSNSVIIIWLLGAISVSLFFIVTYVRTYKEFQTAVPVKNNPYLNEWLQNHKLKRTIQVSISDRITTPLTYKLFKPVIIFPKSTNWSDEKNIQFVLTHEYIHIKRLDVLWKVLLTVILALHWFNPLVWIMYFIVNRDIELSCDEKVIRLIGDDAKSEYALSLINMAEKIHKITPICNSFSKSGIEERIVSIMKIKKTSIFGVALASTLVIGGITLFATTGQASETPSEKINLIEDQKHNQDVKLDNKVQNQSEMNGTAVKNNSNDIILVKTSEGHSKEGKNINDVSQEKEETDNTGYYRLIKDKEQ